jgi:hypothetical protein
MDKNQFQRQLRLGLRRPILYARNHDVRQFRDLILDACIHCYAWDPQIEGARTDYMPELVNLTPEKEFYYDQVLRALAGSGDDYDTQQRFRFAACLAFEGDEEAKRAMYESYEPGPRMGEAIGIHFLQMDGVRGLLFAAETIGSLLMAKTEKFDLGWLPTVAEEDLGEQVTWAALQGGGDQEPSD